MKKNSYSEIQLLELRELRDSGIPIPTWEENDPHVLRSGILIRETTRGSAIELDPYFTVYIVPVRIVSNLPGSFAISSFHLALPWEGARIVLLEDPAERESPSSDYRLPCSRRMAFPRNQVLNHLEDLRRVLHRGDFIQGVLIWYGYEPVPEGYAQGDDLAAFVTVYDQFSREYRGAISLFVDRKYRLERVASRRRLNRDMTGPSIRALNRSSESVDVCFEQIGRENPARNLSVESKRQEPPVATLGK
jgi:hypothetical protein